MITTQLQKKKLTFSFLSFFPFYFLSCYSQFSNWLHFQSNLPISISPSHPPLNRAALQVSVGLWYLFMINEGEKKKCKCLPPTQGEINQNRSAGRKEGKGGRKATADRSPLKALKPGNHPSSHIYTQAHAPASADAHTRKRSATHKAVQTRPNLRRGACQKIELECFPSNTLRCLYNNETSPALNAMDVSAGASGRAFLMLFSKYQRQYELHWMRLYPPNRPPTQTTLCWQCLSLEPEQPTIYQKRLSVSTDLHPLAQCLLNHCFLIVQFVGFFALFYTFLSLLGPSVHSPSPPFLNVINQSSIHMRKGGEDNFKNTDQTMF